MPSSSCARRRSGPACSGTLIGARCRRLENCEQTGVLARKDRLHVCAAGETLGNELSAAHRSPEVQGSKPGMLGFSGLLSVRGECEQLGGGASHLRTGLSPKAPVIVVFWGAPRASGRGHVTISAQAQPFTRSCPISSTCKTRCETGAKHVRSTGQPRVNDVQNRC